MLKFGSLLDIRCKIWGYFEKIFPSLKNLLCYNFCSFSGQVSLSLQNTTSTLIRIATPHNSLSITLFSSAMDTEIEQFASHDSGEALAAKKPKHNEVILLLPEKGLIFLFALKQCIQCVLVDLPVC